MMNKYFQQFAQDRCGADLHAFFGNNPRSAKEITESYGMLYSVFNFFPEISRYDERVVVHIVGDGCMPHTGAVVAYHTKWNVVSIDPVANIERWEKLCTYREGIGEPIQRLAFIKSKVEGYHEVTDSEMLEYSDVFSSDIPHTRIILLPHSHASIDDTLSSLHPLTAGARHLISMPCCLKTPDKYLSMKYTHEHNFRMYRDEHILSPKNEIYCWSYV